MTREGIDLIMKDLKWEVWPERSKGGQQCGMGPRGVKLTHPDFIVEICVGDYRTQMQNLEAAREMFELFLIGIK